MGGQQRAVSTQRQDSAFAGKPEDMINDQPQSSAYQTSSCSTGAVTQRWGDQCQGRVKMPHARLCPLCSGGFDSFSSSTSPSPVTDSDMQLQSLNSATRCPLWGSEEYCVQ